jgi:hypothetical protein
MQHSLITCFTFCTGNWSTNCARQMTSYAELVGTLGFPLSAVLAPRARGLQGRQKSSSADGKACRSSGRKILSKPRTKRKEHPPKPKSQCDAERSCRYLTPTCRARRHGLHLFSTRTHTPCHARVPWPNRFHPSRRARSPNIRVGDEREQISEFSFHFCCDYFFYKRLIKI